MGTLFDVSSPKKKFDANKLSFGGAYRYVARTSQNNGIRGYIDEDTAFLNDGQTISFGQDTATIFYQDLPYFTGDKIKILSLLSGSLSSKAACYLLGTMRKAFANFQWGVDSFEEDVLKKVCLVVPISQEKVDFNYMETYVGILAGEYASKINSYLKKYSLTDCTLTDTEQASLQRLQRGEVIWRPFAMNKVFVPLKAPYLRKGTRRQDHVSRIRTKEFCLPVVCAKRGDNGIMKFGRREDFTYHSNVIAIICDGVIATGLTYAYEGEVGIFTHSFLIKYLKEEIPFEVNLFLKTAIQKKIYPIYSREHSARWKNRVENEEIYLPIDSNEEIDVEFMRTIICAEKKILARKVIAYKKDIEKGIDNRVQAITPHNTTIPFHSSHAYNYVEFEPMMAAEDIFIEGSVPVDLPKTDRSHLLDEQLGLVLMYAIGPKARNKTETAGKIALGIKEESLSKEQMASYMSVKYVVFHYWKNPMIYMLSQKPRLVVKGDIPDGYLLRLADKASKFLLLEYNTELPVDMGTLNILKTQRRGHIRYLPFVTTLESITDEEKENRWIKTGKVD